MAILSYFGRETSLVNIIGPRSIFPIQFTPTINLLLYLIFRCYHYHYYLVRFILCKQQGRKNSQILCTRWEANLFDVCAGPGEVSNLGCKRRHCSLHRLLVSVGVLLARHSTLASSLREIAAIYISTFHFG